VSIDEAQRSEIQRLYHAEHWKVGTIAKQLGIHHDTVEKALGLKPPRVQSVRRARLLDPYVEFIGETLDKYPTLRATRVYDMLRERGYTGSERTVRRYVRDVRPTPKHEVFLRTDPLCGEQAQVDWAHVTKVPVPGGMRVLWLFVIVLSYSRAMWAEFVHDMTAASLCRSLVRAAAWFGGLPRQFLFDNPKTIVLERNGDDIRFHPRLLTLCGQLRVQPRLCAVGKGNQKGRVERTIRYMRDRYLAGRIITSIEQGNASLRTFIDEIAHERPHPRMRTRTVADVLSEEREHLLTLPEPLPVTDLYQPVRVDKTAFIRFDTNDYSVPPQYARETLTMSCDDKVLRVFSKEDLVATHPRCWGRHQTVEEPEHRAELLAIRRAARAPKGRDRLTACIPDCDVLFQRWLEDGHHLGTHVARTLKLLDLYGQELLGQAVQEAIVHDIRDPSALTVICDRHHRARTRPAPVAVPIPDHVEDHDVIQHPLASYDLEDGEHD
jgi:transposase